MTISSHIAAALLAMVFCASASLASAQEAPGGRPNLLPNGDFAKGMEGWNVHPHGKIGTATIDEVEKRDGKPVMKLSNSKGDDLIVSYKLTVKPKTRYRITGYIKTKDIVPDDAKGKAGASLSVTGGFEHSEMVLKTKPWTKVSMEYDTGNKTEIEVGPRLGHYSNKVSGTAWFADLTVVEIGKSRK